MTDTAPSAVAAGLGWLVERTAEQHLERVLELVAADPVYAELRALAPTRPDALEVLERSLIILSHGVILEGLADVLELEHALSRPESSPEPVPAPPGPAGVGGRLRAAWARIRARS